MGYTRETLEQAITAVVDEMGGVRHLFSNHRLHQDGSDLDRFVDQWPTLPIESRVGKVACVIGPFREGDRGVITAAYDDLCRKNALAFS